MISDAEEAKTTDTSQVSALQDSIQRKGEHRIYVDMDGVGETDKEKITLEHSAQSFTLRIRNHRGKNLVLHIPKLYDEINNASFRVKPNKVVIALRKKGDFRWYDLKSRS